MESETDLGLVVGGRYFLLDSIGQGGMADVHLARDQHDGHLVAVKWLSRSHRADHAFRERMQLEAKLLAQVNHPNVVQLFDFGVTGDGVPYLVLEALTGETLHEYLVRRKSMTVAEALPLAMQVARALQAVHCAGLVHGDVKPHNIFLCGERDAPQCVKLIDFGFAQLLSGDTSLDSDIVTGTLEYMAPEQILGEPIDARSDIYSFGIVLFRWLTGELPFDTGPMMGLLGHHLQSAAPPPSWLVDDLNPGLEQLILTAMRKNPDNRYPSMAEVIRDLECVISGMTKIHGAPLLHTPDEYTPLSEQGKRAYKIIHRSGIFEKPEAPVEARRATVVA